MNVILFYLVEIPIKINKYVKITILIKKRIINVKPGPGSSHGAGIPNLHTPLPAKFSALVSL